MNDPNLYIKFKPYWGCPYCAANWEKPNILTVYGKVDAVAIGCIGEDGDFQGDEVDTGDCCLCIDNEDGHLCHQCENYLSGPEHYGSQAQVNKRIIATPGVHRAT